MKLGIDIGSKNISIVLLNNQGVIFNKTFPHNGNIFKTLIEEIENLLQNYNIKDIESYGICGSVDLAGIKTIDTILASVESNKFLKTGSRYILSIGCESYSLVVLDENFNYVEHSVNPLCASGTGSFIDQQAERIGLTSEELGEISDKFQGKTPIIATRCAVFAKSDIIHSQAEGFSKEAIAAGLCEGMARGVLSNLLKGRDLNGDVLFTGGVSKNKKIVSEISKILGIKVKIIKESVNFNAIGAALLGNEKDLDLKKVISNISKNREKRDELQLELTNYPDFNEDKTIVEDNIEITKYSELTNKTGVYIGIDIGSTSTKSIITDENNEILYGFYTKTAGDPVKATQNIFHKIKKIFSDKEIKILGVGTTGSGRKLVKEIINADIEINEITAHARGATFLSNDVDTIIEIGGQDSKFTLLKNGNVVSSTMNYVCAAGTGSFIEEQAKRLDITLDDISKMAIGRKAPYTSDRCTVYMERDLNLFLSEGYSKEEIITAVLYSVRDNYLSKVVGRENLGDKIFFQGATARNKALVAVFEKEIKKPICVSKYCHLTGALGIAVILKERKYQKSQFSGIDFEFKLSTEICEICVNKCALSIYEVRGNKVAWGLKCGREYEDRKVKVKETKTSIDKIFEDVFIEKNGNGQKEGKKIGIPKTLYLTEFYPLFKDFFEKAGFTVVIEEPSHSKLKNGSKLVNSDFCAPIILTHGLVESLQNKKVDYIFIPTIINNKTLLKNEVESEFFIDKINDAYYCYYSEYAATIVDNLTALNVKDKLLSPKMKFNKSNSEDISKELIELIANISGVDRPKLAEIFNSSYAKFLENKKEFRKAGDNILKNGDKNKILFLGRPYTFFDNIINLNIPKTFENYGFDILYQSMLDLDPQNLDYAKRFIDKAHWTFGQEIICASEFAAKTDGLFPVFLTCFRCSPDSYLISYFKDIMNKYEKPYLIIQLDEHSSDVGYQTRIEAAIETFKNHKPVKTKNIEKKTYKNDPISMDDTILIPYVSPIISELQKSVFNSYGYKAIVMALDQKIINKGYRYASGGECMPNVAIAGSLIETIEKHSLNPENCIAYLPTLCMACNFNQYSILLELASEKAGYDKIKIANGNSMKHIDELPKELNVNILEVNILGSILYKLYYKFRPYTKNPADIDSALNKSLELIKTNLTNKKSLMEAAKEIKIIFQNLQVDISVRKPRIAILGDLYAKYNFILNDDIYSLIEDLDGEALVPSFTETASHFLDADYRDNGLDIKYKRGLSIFERRYESVFKELLEDSLEPPMDEQVKLMENFGIKNFIAGETSMNIGRALYYIKNKTVDAIVHLNPLFCCPGVVSASIFRKIQKDFDIPIIDIFYDGNNKPNKIIIPQLYYLKNKGKS